MPRTVEQAKFEYSPLSKIFTEGVDKNYQKDGLFKRLKNIEDKNEEHQNYLLMPIKPVVLQKMEVIIIMTNKFAFYKFYRDFQNFKNRSLESKYDNIKKFYMALKGFKKHDAITAETEEHRTRVMNNFVTLQQLF